MYHSLFPISLLKDMLFASKFGVVTNKAAINIHEQVFVLM